MYVYMYICGFSLYSCSTLSITTHLAPPSSFQMISILIQFGLVEF